jgi:tRNA 2-thiouridine synthesizing protein A
MTQFDHELDTRGLNCPLPILRAKKFLNTMATGKIVRVMTTDPGSVKDFEAFAKQTGIEEGALPILFTILPITNIPRLIGKGISSLPMVFMGFPLPGVVTPIGVRIGTLPIHIAVLKLSDVLLPVGMGIGSFPMTIVVLKFPDIG